MELLTARHGPVEVLTLNRPAQRNALTPGLIAALSAALGEAAASEEVRAVVLTAVGDKAFCAGMDLGAFALDRNDHGARTNLHYDRFATGCYPKPVIAAINGSAVAGGFELLLHCDLAVAARHAMFGLPEVKRGLFPAGGGTLLPSRIPLALALEFGLTGELVDASRLLQLGLLNRVVDSTEVVGAALALAQRVASNAPLGVAATRRAMWRCSREGTEAARRSLQASIDEVFQSDDALEGARAFTEKRPPRWTGK
ncbi:enoyl-CoA hydratase/isomerase family protein [Massilia putida]|uniref:enoyl-CoA hydratase/isomerase family protein n=1 Tax=Massilia putida TaxID=1141883 RepID=UPI000951982D|nr:enoyl-CoA hydratase-related protein [Massilia putida]